MLRNDTIQEGIITELKSLSAITALVTNSLGDYEIRETEWRGTVFEYPNIRVEMEQVPSIEGCGYGEIDFTIKVFSESSSSKECSNIAGIVFQTVPRSFTSNGILFTGVICRRLGKALPVGVRTWQVNVDYQAIVNG